MPNRESAARRATARLLALRASVVAAALVACLVGSGLTPVRSTFAAAQSSSALDPRDEYAVKSAFLFNFAARHVKWPESAFRDRDAPFVLGVLGKGGIAAVLEETCRGRKSGDRFIQVRVVDDLAGASDCHILFVPSARDAEIPALATALEKKPVLLVAESEVAVRRGAHIGFFLERSKVRFAAHPPSARQSGLEISSELLKLARVVERRAEDQP